MAIQGTKQTMKLLYRFIVSKPKPKSDVKRVSLVPIIFTCAAYQKSSLNDAASRAQIFGG
jgi:hypothetical protein